MLKMLRKICIYALAILMTSASTILASPAASANSENAAKRLQKASETCMSQITTTTNAKIEKSATATPAYVRCVATALDLWSDAEGYNSKHVAKLFHKQQLPEEVQVVADYCNQRHRQADLDMWAYEAYKCATAGRMGVWLRDYMNKENIENLQV